MTKYIVQPVPNSSTPVPYGTAISFTPSALVQEALQKASRLRYLVREFQQQNPGAVELITLEDWNTEVEIEATPEAAELLRHFPGIGEVEEWKPKSVHYHRGPI